MDEKKGKNIARKNWVRKLARLIFFVALIFALSGASLIFLNHYLLPQLASVKWLNKYKFLKKINEDVVVVNKTEQITISEDQTISRYSNKSAASVVEIISYKKNAKAVGDQKDASQIKFGSGLVVTADGLILTHRDAIFEDQSNYRIFVDGGKSFDARLIAEDSYTRLAFLKIDGIENLPVASFISPEDLKAGTKIVAIGRNGNNFGIIFKSGLVSQYSADFSLAGPLASSEKLQGMYFADIDMREEGDEKMIGGVVTDYNGNVVGMLGVRRISQSSQYFIVPVDHIKSLVDQYLSKGTARRASLGVYYLSLTDESASVFKGMSKGALVYSSSLQQGLAVIVGSAAEKAGIKIQDIIVSVNGEEINFQNNLAYLISKYQPGDKVELNIIRDGKEMTIPVVLD